MQTQTLPLTLSRDLIVNAVSEYLYRFKAIPENFEVSDIHFSDWQTLSGEFGQKMKDNKPITDVAIKVIGKREQEVTAKIYNG